MGSTEVQSTLTEKTCPSCKQVLPIASFYADLSRKDGYSAYCKKCQNLHRKKSRNKKNPPKPKVDWSKVSERTCLNCNRLLPLSSFYTKWQRSGPCKDCEKEIQRLYREKNRQQRKLREPKTVTVQWNEDQRAKQREQTRACRERARAVKLGLLPVGGRNRQRAFRPVDVPCYWCMRHYNPEDLKCPDCGTPYDAEKSRAFSARQKMSYLDIVRKKEGAAGVAKVRKARNLYDNDLGFNTTAVQKQLEAYLKKMGYSIRRFNNRRER